MLKLFPYLITQVYPEGGEFIEAFKRFTRRTLCTQGICSLSSHPKEAEGKNGTYAIKGTTVFLNLGMCEDSVSY